MDRFADPETGTGSTRVGLLRVANACEAGTGLWIREALHFLTARNVKSKIHNL